MASGRAACCRLGSGWQRWGLAWASVGLTPGSPHVTGFDKAAGVSAEE